MGRKQSQRYSPPAPPATTAFGFGGDLSPSGGRQYLPPDDDDPNIMLMGAPPVKPAANSRITRPAEALFSDTDALEPDPELLSALAWLETNPLPPITDSLTATIESAIGRAVVVAVPRRDINRQWDEFMSSLPAVTREKIFSTRFKNLSELLNRPRNTLSPPLGPFSADEVEILERTFARLGHQLAPVRTGPTPRGPSRASVAKPVAASQSARAARAQQVRALRRG